MIELSDKKLINRDISWLNFNERVLQEAMDRANPLLERVNFLGIFSNNRDEFYRVRIAALKRLQKIEDAEGGNPEAVQEVLDKVAEILENQDKKFSWVYRKLVIELYRENIVLINEKQLSEAQGKEVRKYFREKVRPYLFPLMLDNLENITMLKDRSIYLAVICKNSKDEEQVEYAIAKVPSKMHSRFIRLASDVGRHYIIMLDDVIRYCLDDVFGVFGYDTFEAYTIKFTRDAELDVDYDVSKSFLEAMAESVKKRKKGNPVRFIYDDTMPKKLLTKLRKRLKLKNDDDIRPGTRYHNFKDFMDFPKFNDKKHLYFKKQPPMFHPALPINASIFDVIRQKDVCLHYPYQSFQHIVDWLREASIDPNVTTIKMTFYRTAKYSNVVNALINAARSGKSVTVFMELQARFDEEANIQLTGKFKEEGVKVIQAIPGYKVHSKLIYIKRKENGGSRSYANISTGNFHESTAKIYADDALLTSNQEITQEVDRIFQLFEERYSRPVFKHLIISPFYTRDFFLDLFDKEMKNVKKGKEAWVIVKLNNLTDKRLANKIYEASQAGVKITLIIRGICVVVPGIKGLSENIEAFAIVDKYLEHSRVLVYANGGEPKFFITSADWMPRNLDHRIETTAPVLDVAIQEELLNMLLIQMKDNTKSRWLTKENPNQYRKSDNDAVIQSQVEIFEYLKKRHYEEEVSVKQEDE